jgi:hypothetical protein
MNAMPKIILIAFDIINFAWPFFLAWFIAGFIGNVMGIFLGVFHGSEFWLGPLTLIAAIAYLVEERKRKKKE